jgi:hypothetical protein
MRKTQKGASIWAVMRAGIIMIVPKNQIFYDSRAAKDPRNVDTDHIKMPRMLLLSTSSATFVSAR